MTALALTELGHFGKEFATLKNERTIDCGLLISVLTTFLRRAFFCVSMDTEEIYSTKTPPLATHRRTWLPDEIRFWLTKSYHFEIIRQSAGIR